MSKWTIEHTYPHSHTCNRHSWVRANAEVSNAVFTRHHSIWYFYGFVKCGFGNDLHFSMKFLIVFFAFFPCFCLQDKKHWYHFGFYIILRANPSEIVKTVVDVLTFVVNNKIYSLIHTYTAWTKVLSIFLTKIVVESLQPTIRTKQHILSCTIIQNKHSHRFQHKLHFSFINI